MLQGSVATKTIMKTNFIFCYYCIVFNFAKPAHINTFTIYSHQSNLILHKPLNVQRAMLSF